MANSGLSNCRSSTLAASVGELITEGKAQVFLAPNVFYNPVQEFNRDLTIAVISEYEKLLRQEKQAKIQKTENAQQAEKTLHEGSDGSNSEESMEVIINHSEMPERNTGECYSDGLVIFEGLAATGLRSVRFCKEIPGLKRVIANDFDRNAVTIINENIKLNNLEHLATSSCGDAAMHMYGVSRSADGLHSKDRGYDVIDLDPYGGPTPFLDSAVQAVKDGGLLCVTCTDMAILCGNASEKCYAAYGSMSLKAKCCHELAVRIVLRTIDSFCNRYSKYIVPLLAVSVDFYCRVFVRVFYGPTKAKESASKTAMVYECTGCSTHTLQPLARIVESKADNTQTSRKYTFSSGPPVDKLCDHCGHTHHIGGPIWAAPIHDMMFVHRVLKSVTAHKEKFGTGDRLIGMLTLVTEELPDVPLYYIPDQLSSVIHCTCPGFVKLRSAIMHAGFRVSLSHAHKSSLKTDAPAHILWDILRCWAQRNPVKESRRIEGTPCHAILSHPPELEANFEPLVNVKPASLRNGLLRYQTGKKDWGPKPRASNRSGDNKRKLNQNKRASKKAKASASQEQSNKAFPCSKFRRAGVCPYGDQCRYSHIAADEQTGESIAEPSSNGSTAHKPADNASVALLPAPDETHTGEKTPAQTVAVVGSSQ